MIDWSSTTSSPMRRSSLAREVELEGRPVALVTFGDRFIVLERPHGDERHVEPGWWEVFDLDGNRTDGRNLAGFYPDDLAVSMDGRHLFVISSGQAEGDPKKPMPALEALAARPGLRQRPHRCIASSSTPRTIRPGSLSRPRDDSPRCSWPRRIRPLPSTSQPPRAPAWSAERSPPRPRFPIVSQSADSDWIMMPVASPSEAIAIPSPVAQHGRALRRRGRVNPAP